MSEERKTRLAIIAAHGTLDAAYPPLILASAAAAMDMEVAIFFTFYGLDMLKKGKLNKLQVAPLANPAMPQPVPGISVPNILGVLPGMTAVATAMMNSWMGKANVAKLSDLMDACKESGVRLIGCKMTMDVMGVKESDIIDGVELGGAATFLEFASQNAITLAF